eukprot:Colp12_sorted_trinity150504_noHs@1163
MADAERRNQARIALNQKLIDTGEKERLKEMLRTKLIECGWRDNLKAHCREIVKKKGLEYVTVEELIAEITPKGRATVPDHIKAELFTRVRQYLSAVEPPK